MPRPARVISKPLIIHVGVLLDLCGGGVAFIVFVYAFFVGGTTRTATLTEPEGGWTLMVAGKGKTTRNAPARTRTQHGFHITELSPDLLFGGHSSFAR